MDSISSTASLSTALSSQSLNNQLQTALLKKAQDIETTQGQDAVKLIQSAAPSSQGIDVYA